VNVWSSGCADDTDALSTSAAAISQLLGFIVSSGLPGASATASASECVVL
jgi:hypothetical protein